MVSLARSKSPQLSLRLSGMPPATVCKSSLKQTYHFSEKPRIVLPEVFIPHVHQRALYPKMENILIGAQMRRVKRLLFINQCIGNYQHLCSQLNAHLCFNPALTFPSTKKPGKVCFEQIDPCGRYEG